MTAGVVGAVNFWPAGTPDFTYTKTLPSAFAGPATTFSSVGVVLYLALHAASSLMSMVGLRGAVPVNLILPVIVPPAAEFSAGAAGCVAGAAVGVAAGAAVGVAAVAAELRFPLLHTVSASIAPTTLRILPFIAASGRKSSAAPARRPTSPTRG